MSRLWLHNTSLKWKEDRWIYLEETQTEVVICEIKMHGSPSIVIVMQWESYINKDPRGRNESILLPNSQVFALFDWDVNLAPYYTIKSSRLEF